MNSLVVLLSVLALVNAEPSGLEQGVIAYATPEVIAPVAVSHQSQVNIKSSPAIVAQDIVAPVARTVIVPQGVIAPAAIAAPAAVAAPATIAAPIAYSAPIGIAPAAVSTESRLDIKSTPAVVNTYAAAPLIQLPQGVAAIPLGFKAPIAYQAIYSGVALEKSVEIPASDIAYSKIYSGIPLANVAKVEQLKSVDATAAPPQDNLPVAPSETPEVAAARAAHLEAKAFEEAHRVQKRSVPLISAPVISTYAAPIVQRYAAAPIPYAPLGRIAVAAPFYRYV